MPKIDLRTFLDDDNVLIVCKSVNGKGSQWILIFDDEICEIEFGRIVMSWLNQINPLKPDNNNVVENLITEINCKASPDEANRRSESWKKHYDSIVDFIMKKHIKSQDELMSFYKKYRYLAHYYFSSLSFEAFGDVPPHVKKPSEIGEYTIVNNQLYQIITVYGFTNLFVLDLRELLFNNNAKYKIKQCKKCKTFFRTSKKNRDYCIDCQKSKEDYAKEYRNSITNKLKKSILTKLKTNKKFANEEGDKKTEEFMKAFEYYRDIVVKGTSSHTEPSDCDHTIITKEDFIKWLVEFEKEVRVYNKEVQKNGETNETCERNGSDHEGIGQTQEALSSDDHPWME